VVTAPTETAIKAGGVVVGVNKPQDVLDPVKNVARLGGDVIIGGAHVVLEPQKAIYAKASAYVDQHLGHTASFLFDVGTFSQAFYTSLGYTSTVTLGNTLKGQNPFVIVAAPLAAAIHEANARYAGKAQPLPPDVVSGLKGVFPDPILAKARWVRGDVEITMPNFIGKGEKYMGDHYAVVVDNIIVFNVQPPSFRDGAWWWAHEITHVEQYTRWGIELFAYNYLKDLGKSIEAEGNNKGYAVQSSLPAGSSLRNPVYPMSKIYKSDEQLSFNETIVSQCKFDKDSMAVSYLVTSKGNIFAVDPITSKYIQIGYAKPPKYAGTIWTFSTQNVQYGITGNGDILTYKKIRNPEGQVIDNQSIKVGSVDILQETCRN
jgi:hypothetical protein